jgi:hypothetical protein
MSTTATAPLAVIPPTVITVGIAANAVMEEGMAVTITPLIIRIVVASTDGTDTH